jgi:hypothetical protein
MKMKWLETGCRYFICLLMLVYGLVKVFNAQFYTDYYWKDMPLGKLSGMQLTWAFYSYSPVYETMLGLAEVTAGLLVLFKKTSKLGVLLFVAIMLNLVTINIVFNIGALSSAIPLLIAGIILLVIYRKEYAGFFFSNQSAQNIVSLKTKITKAAVIIIGCTLAFVIIFNNKYRIKNDDRIKGTWEAVSGTAIKRIYFEKGDACITKNHRDSLHFFIYKTMGNNKLLLVYDNNLSQADSMDYTIKGDSVLVTKDNAGETIQWKKVLYTHY